MLYSVYHYCWMKWRAVYTTIWMLNVWCVCMRQPSIECYRDMGIWTLRTPLPFLTEIYHLLTAVAVLNCWCIISQCWVSLLFNIHCEPKYAPKCFCHIFRKNPVNSDKICYPYMLCWINLWCSNLNVFHLLWIMLLQYLVKLSICVL